MAILASDPSVRDEPRGGQRLVGLRVSTCEGRHPPIMRRVSDNLGTSTTPFSREHLRSVVLEGKRANSQGRQTLNVLLQRPPT